MTGAGTEVDGISGACVGVAATGGGVTEAGVSTSLPGIMTNPVSVFSRNAVTQTTLVAVKVV